MSDTVKNGHNTVIPNHLLRKSPFDVLLNSFIIWISDKEASRIIQSHHVTYTNERFFWPRVETQQLIALFFLPFGTPDSGSKFRRYQVFMSYHWASAGMTKGNRLSKRKRNVLRRDDYFYFHNYSFQLCITDQAWGQYDWIYGQIPFLHFVRLSRSPLFFPGWLCHETSSLVRSLRDLIHWSSSSLIFKNLWGVASLAFCLPRRVEANKKKNDANIQLSWPKKLGQ